MKHSLIENDTLPLRCRPQEWLTPIGRERTHLQKQQQGKGWETKARQDLPANVSINSRLLACKAERDKLYNRAKPTLRVSPYFQILALIKICPFLTFLNQLYSNHFNYNYYLY
jgi:hypothetical protein